MKTFASAATVIALASVAALAQQPPAAPPPCVPEGQIRVVCGQDGPEDLVEVPGTPWLIASAYGQQGGLFLIDTRALSSRRLFPDASATDRHDKKTYADCPGPPQGAMRERFRT